MSSKLNLSESVEAEKWSLDVSDQLEKDLKKIEATLKLELEKLENSLGQRQTESETRTEEPSDRNYLLRTTDRIISVLKRVTRAGEGVLKDNNELRKQLKDQQYLLEQMEMERDVLLQQVYAYLETNSSLRVRLEEQRCQTGTIQRQLNADLESRIKELENEKEELNDLNMEKDKQIHKMSVMLEQTAKCLKNRETEMLNWKNEENNLVTLLKADLQKTLEEKAKIEDKYASLKERFEDYFIKNIQGVKHVSYPTMKRSLSMSDFRRKGLHIMGKNIVSSDITTNCFCPRQFFEDTSDENSTSWKVHACRSWPNGVSALPQTVCTRLKSPSVHAQLNGLRRDLLSVTKKLELLKCQLVSSGVITEDSQPTECRRLKRKANPMEDAEGEVSEEQKSEFKDLKNILQDAKNLNAKLQNLREEKQKMIDLNKKEVGVQVAEKKNDDFCQKTHGAGPPFGICKTR